MDDAMSNAESNPLFLEYCCPRCKGPLASAVEKYTCTACAAHFPVVLGIPDFRVFSDPYLSIADDHRKGARIAERAAAGASFEELVRYYWSITPDEPPEMAERFTALAVAAAERGRDLLKAQPRVDAILRRSTPARVLDVGSRTGGLLLAAAERAPEVVGIDIAFRWLIVARKRLEEVGRPAQLVCCCAEFLPFKPGSFDVVVAENVLEHTARQQDLIEEAHRVLMPGGVFFATTWNRLAAAPEPHVRLWGVGWLPLAQRQRYVKWRKGVSYDHVRLLSVFQLRRMVRHTSFGCCAIKLPEFSEAQLASVSVGQRAVVNVYHRIKNWPVIRGLLLLVAPVFHVVCVRRSNMAADIVQPPPATERNSSSGR